MVSQVRIAARSVRLVLATMLCVVVSKGTLAADAEGTSMAPGASAAQQPTEQLEELAEIWVRGEGLANLIEDAEDDFFELYNQLNQEDDYDISCGYMSITPGSMIMERTCVPGFLVAYSAGNYRGGHYSGSYYAGGSFTTASYRRSTTATCYGSPAMVNGAAHFEGGCYGSVDSGYTAYSAAPYHQSPASLVAVHRREEYASNVMQVISSDPGLLEKAAHLATLYEEMELVQNRYMKVRKASGSKRHAVRHSLGPRAR